MSDEPRKPSAIIFGIHVLVLHSRILMLVLGGLNTCSRALATYLVPVDGEPLVSVCANYTLCQVRPILLHPSIFE